MAVADREAARLIEATLARFERHGREREIAIRTSLRFRLETTIPRQVGLGGSSAIVLATLRALFDLHALDVDAGCLAELALAVEAEDLKIPAGPQDRVVQAHEGLLSMDFASAGAPAWERFDPELLRPLFIAYRADASSRRQRCTSDCAGVTTMAIHSCEPRSGRSPSWPGSAAAACSTATARASAA